MIHGGLMAEADIARRVVEPLPSGFLNTFVRIGSLTLVACADKRSESLANFTIFPPSFYGNLARSPRPTTPMASRTELRRRS